MVDYVVSNYADIVNALTSANANTSNDNLRFQNDIILTPEQTIDLMTRAGSGNLRFRAPANSTATPTLVVQSALNINDNDPSSAQPSFAIGPFQLQIGSGGTDGSLAGNLRVDDGGILAFDRSVDTTYTGTLSVEDEDNALLNMVAGTTVTLDGTAGTNGLALRASQGTGAANAYELEIGGDGDGVISGIIADGGIAARPGNLTKTGDGTWTFSGVNSYVGTTTVSEGTLKVTSASGLGATIGAGTGATAAAAGTVVEDGATLALQAGAGNGIAIGAETLSLEGEGVAGGGALRNLGGANSFAGNITLTGDALVASDAGSLTLGGTIGAAFGLTLGGDGNGSITGAIQSDVTTVSKEGDGIWSLSGDNAYAGGTALDDGTLELGTLTSAGTGAITFGDDAQTLQVDVAGTLGNTITGFSVGDVLDLTTIDSSGATFTLQDGVLTVTESAAVGSDSNSFAIGAAQSGYRYVLGSDGNGGTTVMLQDAVAPDTPPAPTLTAESDTGVSNSDGLTRRTKPTFTGTAEAGATVTLYEGTSVLGSAVADSDGNYTVQSNISLSEGDHTLSVTAADAAGNTSASSPGVTITIDTTAPDTPAAPSLARSSDTGAADGITADATPTFSGKVGAGETVTLYDVTSTIAAAKIIGSVVAGADGSWSIEASALGDGAHGIRARSTDAAGNISGYSNATRVVIDTSTPAAPSAPSLTTTSDTGTSSTDGITRDATPTFTGTAEAGTTVRLYDGDTLVGTARANGSGAYTVTASSLGSGDHTLTTIATDAAGNASAASAGTSITIDTSAPARPSTPALTAASDTGASSTDGITSDATPTLTGKADAGSTVTLYDGTKATGVSVVAGADGSWEITAGTLSDGAHTLRTRASDAAGNLSAFSQGRRIVVDTQDPDVEITTGDGTYTSARQTVTGTGEAGSRITLADDETGVVYGSVTVRADGTWSRTITLQKGENEIGATAVDKAGNTASSDEIVLTYDRPGAGSQNAAFAAPHMASADPGLTSALFDAAFAPSFVTDAPPVPHAADLAAAHLVGPTA